MPKYKLRKRPKIRCSFKIWPSIILQLPPFILQPNLRKNSKSLPYIKGPEGNQQADYRQIIMATVLMFSAGVNQPETGKISVPPSSYDVPDHTDMKKVANFAL